ncbi:hypothetical protein LF41_1143 [Lysobacter dokdonensis DS-58]|uniref:Uncharacterized protein n=1 Tax=Lysobacter dokdonensis DS-58 TaxID=1300345 RepID=A0A0A2WK87_9GAMM|nr:hypothetical protein LF41_1143 [Lysobacter dokdonensis DS-58]
MTPTTFCFSTDVTLWFDDGELFHGHFLSVSGGREAPEYAQMMG